MPPKPKPTERRGHNLLPAGTSISDHMRSRGKKSKPIKAKSKSAPVTSQ